MEKAEFCVLDANLNEATLAYTIRLLEEINSECQIVYEPVSVKKSVKILRVDLLGKVTIIKPNIGELMAMCNNIRAQNKEKEVSRPQSKDCYFYVAGDLLVRNRDEFGLYKEGVDVLVPKSKEATFMSTEVYPDFNGSSWDIGNEIRFCKWKSRF